MKKINLNVVVLLLLSCVGTTFSIEKDLTKEKQTSEQEDFEDYCEDYWKKIAEFGSTTLEKALEGIKDPNYTTSAIVFSFMHNTKEHSEEDVLELLKAIPLTKGNVYGYWATNTALLSAVSLKYISVIDYLIEQGADINETYSPQITVVGLPRSAVAGPPLLLAVLYRDLPTIKYLVEQGANIHQEVDVQYDGNIITPFKRAQELGYDEIIDLFKSNESFVIGTANFSKFAVNRHYVTRNRIDITPEN